MCELCFWKKQKGSIYKEGRCGHHSEETQHTPLYPKKNLHDDLHLSEEVP